MGISAGIARRPITPFAGVELTGWGYYIERRWREIHDELQATALVVDDGRRAVCLVALDLMVIGSRFTKETRERIHAATGIPAEAILLSCSHSHNAPASEGLLGVGEVDPLYEEWASRQAATAAALAWQARVPARLASAQSECAGCTYNRTRPAGPTDTTCTILRVDRADGSPLAAVVSFQAHPTVHTRRRPWAVSRDVPGEVCDAIEAALPGCTALYLQGACGDVNFLSEYDQHERQREPGERVAAAALNGLARAVAAQRASVAATAPVVALPTRRWTRDEIDGDRREALYRIESGDTSGWKDSIGRVMTNHPDDMVARHGGDVAKAVRAMCRFSIEWTDRMLRDYETRPESLTTETQAIRIGDVVIVANASELFTTLALDLRDRFHQIGQEHVMISCYSNGRIGYMPDAYDIARKTYAAYQSPKYCDQFPFTDASGPALVEGMFRAGCSVLEQG